MNKLFIKGFDENLRCYGGMQFEVGETYDTRYTEDLELCSDKVFHFCETLQQVHSYYNVSNKQNRFCYVEALGDIVSDDDKCGSNKIKIVREIIGEELERLKGYENGNTGLFNSGDRNSGYWNSGNGSNGVFCTSAPTINMFNKPTGMTLEQFRCSKYWSALFSVELPLTYVENEELKTRSYKEACSIWWNDMSEENKEIIKDMPNFDEEIFEEITGVKI